MSDESSENTGGATEADLPDVADFEALLDMRAPQPGYRTAIEQGGRKDIAIAALNGPQNTVVSGARDAVAVNQSARIVGTRASV